MKVRSARSITRIHHHVLAFLCFEIIIVCSIDSHFCLSTSLLRGNCAWLIRNLSNFTHFESLAKPPKKSISFPLVLKMSNQLSATFKSNWYRHCSLGLVEECDPVIFCLKFGNYLQFTFEMIKDKKAWQINLGLGLKLGLELRVRVRVKVRI